MKAKVRCIETYNDTELNIKITNNSDDKNYERVVSKERADVLVKAGVCEVIEEEQEEEQQEEQEQIEKVETAKLEPDAETAVQKTKTSNKKTE